jgi:hypothetical protein
MEVRYPPEMIQIVSDQDQILDKRRGCDEDIGIANSGPPLAQKSIDLGGLDHDLIVQREHQALLALALESQNLAGGILRLQATKDLVSGNDRELKSLVLAQVLLSPALYREIPPLDDFGKRVRI